MIKFSNPVTPEELKAAYEQGMIRKDALVEGATYRGHCRNSSYATWSAGKGFTYTRKKFVKSYDETLPHPEDDDGFDIFIPLQRVDALTLQPL